MYDESVFKRLSRIMQLRKTKTLMEIKELLDKENYHYEAAMDDGD